MGGFAASTSAAHAFQYASISTREHPWRVFVERPAKSERLTPEFLALTVDDIEYVFQDAMATVSERIGGERLAKNGQIVIITEQLHQSLISIAQLLLAARPCGLEKLQLTPKMPGLLAPFVKDSPCLSFLRPKRARDDLSGMYAGGHPPGRPNRCARSSSPEARERAVGDFCHRSECSVLECAAGHFLVICEQCRRIFKCSPLDRFGGLLKRELIHGLDQHFGVANLSEQPTGVAKTPVLFAVDIVAEILAHKAESGPHFLEAFADVPGQPRPSICRAGVTYFPRPDGRAPF